MVIGLCGRASYRLLERVGGFCRPPAVRKREAEFRAGHGVVEAERDGGAKGTDRLGGPPEALQGTPERLVRSGFTRGEPDRLPQRRRSLFRPAEPPEGDPQIRMRPRIPGWLERDRGPVCRGGLVQAPEASQRGRCCLDVARRPPQTCRLREVLQGGTVVAAPKGERAKQVQRLVRPTRVRGQDGPAEMRSLVHATCLEGCGGAAQQVRRRVLPLPAARVRRRRRRGTGPPSLHRMPRFGRSASDA